jgi:hypothetical protein
VSNVTWHPASHNWLMDINVLSASAGTMNMRRAAGGSIGRSNSASCVARMIAPLAARMRMSFVHGCLLITGKLFVP